MVRGNLWKRGFKSSTWKYRYFEFENNCLRYFVANSDLICAVDELLQFEEESDIPVENKSPERRESLLSPQSFSRARILRERVRQLKKKHSRGKIILESENIDVSIPIDKQTRFKTEFAFEVSVSNNRKLLCCAEEAGDREEWVQALLYKARQAGLTLEDDERVRNRKQSEAGTVFKKIQSMSPETSDEELEFGSYISSSDI